MAQVQCCRYECVENKLPKIQGFWHVASVEEGQGAWMEIVASQLKQLVKSHLTCSSEKITLVAVGRKENISEYLNNLSYPFHVIYAGNDTTQWEFPTLHLLQKYCFRNPKSLVYYFHNKGARYPTSSSLSRKVQDWRLFLEHFTFHNHASCVNALVNEGFNVCGANYKLDPWEHFSGNFWWARCDYINRLPNVMSALDSTYSPWGVEDQNHPRYYAERWIGNPDQEERPMFRNFVSTHRVYEEFPADVWLHIGINETCPKSKRDFNLTWV